MWMQWPRRTCFLVAKHLVHDCPVALQAHNATLMAAVGVNPKREDDTIWLHGMRVLGR